MTTTLVPVAAVLVVVWLDLWVFVDARRCAREGAPVELRIGAVVVGTPAAWFLACLVLWIFFFPVYVVSRSR